MKNAILEFWFDKLTPAQWWQADDALDRQIAERFADVLAQASCCELFAWRDDPAGRLAEIIVLDQFSRNIHRGTPAAFASDSLALALAQQAVALGADMALPQVQRNFLYMPWMHSESRRIHEIGEPLFKSRASADSHGFEVRHKAIIDRFGRYPHRNAILGRQSTAEELAFLQQPGSSF